MCAKKAKTTKKKIVSAAWKLFYEQGYDNTTVDDIVEESGTSKGSFYHYFEGKDALLSSLSFLFDEKYEELMPSVDPQMHSVDKLLYLNRELFGVIENTVSLALRTRSRWSCWRGFFPRSSSPRESGTCLTAAGSTIKSCVRLFPRGSSAGRSAAISRQTRFPSSTRSPSAVSCTTGVSAAATTR